MFYTSHRAAVRNLGHVVALALAFSIVFAITLDFLK